MPSDAEFLHTLPCLAAFIWILSDCGTADSSNGDPRAPTSGSEFHRDEIEWLTGKV